MQDFDFWKLLAGLGIFIFGMFLLEESIQKISGRAFKKLIRRYTTGRFKSILSGFFVTSILQSSSAVSLMILAFVGAGIMSMQNAIGVIIGSNLGTTATAWIVATVGFKMNIESFALPLIGAGGLGIIFLGQSERYSNISKLLVGFGFLFMGLDYMKTSVEVFAQQFDLSTLPDYGILVYLGMGIVLTALMQSSSATMAIVLTTLNAGIISFDHAAGVVIGANVGTTVTILLGAIGGAQIKKRVAYSHFVFNVTTGILALLLLPVLSFFVFQCIDIGKNAVIGLALFHTFFNLLGVIVFFPFIQTTARLLTRIFPDRKTELTLYINNTMTEVAEAGVTALRKEALHLVENVLRHNLGILNIDTKLVFSDFSLHEKDKSVPLPSQMSDYENLKRLQAEISTFAAGIQRHELVEAESLTLNRYLHAARLAIHSAKSLKDVKHNFDDFESSENEFLNDQYVHFRKRMIEACLKVDKIMRDKTEKDITKSILKAIKQLKEDDRMFVNMMTQAINQDQIRDLEVSTVFVVNRAFVQSTKQALLALRDLLLTTEEIGQFEKRQDIGDSLLEYE